MSAGKQKDRWSTSRIMTLPFFFCQSKAPYALKITFCFPGHFTLKKRVTSSTFNAKMRSTIYSIRYQSAFSER